jgi:hypothetical protein
MFFLALFMFPTNDWKLSGQEFSTNRRINQRVRIAYLQSVNSSTSTRLGQLRPHENSFAVTADDA